MVIKENSSASLDSYQRARMPLIDILAACNLSTTRYPLLRNDIVRFFRCLIEPPATRSSTGAAVEKFVEERFGDIDGSARLEREKSEKVNDSR